MSAPAERTAAAHERTAEAHERIADAVDVRTRLAADRTILAAERTYAAWIRTGLAALAAGVGSGALLERVVPTWIALATGVVLCAFSAVSFLAGVWRELVPGTGTIQLDARRLPPALLIAVNGGLAIVALLAAAGLVVRR